MLAVAVSAAVSLAVAALSPQQQAVVVAEARKVLGVPYDLGGRLQPIPRSQGGGRRGLDCQGLIFFALQPISRCGWKSLSVLPTVSVQGELGTPVLTVAAGDAALDEKLATLQPGDLLWFLAAAENPAEPSITTLGGTPMWVWHTGLFAGLVDGKPRFIVGDHFAGAVVEEELAPYLKEHYAGVLVTRLQDGPAPTTCRKHAPMRR